MGQLFVGLLAVVLVFGCWFESFWSWIAALSFDSFLLLVILIGSQLQGPLPL